MRGWDGVVVAFPYSAMRWLDGANWDPFLSRRGLPDLLTGIWMVRGER